MNWSSSMMLDQPTDVPLSYTIVWLCLVGLGDLSISVHALSDGVSAIRVAMGCRRPDSRA